MKKFPKLYLEFGGKLFDDHHFSRCMPGFAPDTKIKMLEKLRDKLEVIVCVCADAIESGQRRHDLGMTYENYVIHAVESFKESGMSVNSVVINKYDSQPNALVFKRRLEQIGITAYIFNKINGYPHDIDRVLSPKGYGANTFIKTTKPLVIVTSPGAKSGKMSVCLSQVYNEHAHGNKKAGYAKFETLPVWNLRLRHPLNISYEASTINIDDVNMIDNYHFEKYGVVAVNYNRDIEAFPLLQNMFRRMYGKDIYYSPTDMGVNMIGFCIEDDALVQVAAKAEVIRRYFETICYFKRGKVTTDAIHKINVLMEQLSLKPSDRAVVTPAIKLKEKTGKHSAALQLPSGDIISASGNGLTSASSELLLKALQKILGIDSKIKIIPDNIMQRTMELKSHALGEKKFHLQIGEILILLSSSSVTNELSAHAIESLPSLKGAEAHITYMASEEESHIWRKLGVNLTQEPIVG